MTYQPTNRKDRISAIRDERTSHSILRQIFEDDKNERVIRTLIRREDMPMGLLEEIYEWSIEESPISIYDFAYRKHMSRDLAERIALDDRHLQGAAMLAANGLLSEEFILNCLDNYPAIRKYFYVFPKNNTAAIRSKLIDLLRESKDRDSLESFVVCQKPTPEENIILHEIFPSSTQSLTEEERRARFDENIVLIDAAYDELVLNFYVNRSASFLFHGISDYNKIFNYDIDLLDCHEHDWAWVMNEYPSPFRAEYLRFSKLVTLKQMQEALVDDYYLPCFYLGCRPDLDPSIAEALMNEEEPFMRHVVAKNMATPLSIARRALTDSSPTVRMGYASRKSMSVSDLIQIFADSAPVVAETPFNENYILPSTGNRNIELVEGSVEEYLTLVQTCSDRALPHLAYILGRTGEPNSWKANNFLGSHENPNVRIQFIRGHRKNDYFSSISPEIHVKLAGDKLSQIRKYALQRAIEGEVLQGDIQRMIQDSRYSEFQKMTLAANVTDRKIHAQLMEYPSDWVKLGAYLNWKATPTNKNSIEFSDSSFEEKAWELSAERDAVGADIHVDPFPDFPDPDNYPSIYKLTPTEQDAYWGGEFPRGWDDEPSQD